jgi:uncharacterized membrane protein HdeD (DUF308 family)
MESKVKNYRSILLINGIIALIFGLFAVFETETTLVTVAKYFGLVLMIGGGIGLFGGTQNRKTNKNYMVAFITAIISIIAGLFILVFTQKSFEIFVIIIGIWALVLALSQLWISLKYADNSQHKKVLLFNGLLTLVFGVILLLNPFQSVVTLFALVGVIAIIFGVVLIYVSIILHPVKENN